MAAGGRVFRAFGHIAHKANQNAMLNTLICINAYNGTILWKRPLPEGFMIHRNTMIATPDMLYLADHRSCKLIDAATGEIARRDRRAGRRLRRAGVEVDGAGGRRAVRPGRRPGSASRPRSPRRRPAWAIGRGACGRATTTGTPRRISASAAPSWPSTRQTKKVLLEPPRGGVRGQPRRVHGGGPDLLLLPGEVPGLSRCRRRQGAAGGTPTPTCWRRSAPTARPSITSPATPRRPTSSATTATCSSPGRSGAGWSWRRPRTASCLAEGPRQSPAGAPRRRRSTRPGRRPRDRIPSPTAASSWPTTPARCSAELPMRRACTRATGSVDSVFFRAAEGTVRIDTATNQAHHIAPMRPPCQDGVIISDGNLYWGPWMCGCQLSLYGHICLAAAGDFNFRPGVDDSRLRTWPTETGASGSAADPNRRLANLSRRQRAHGSRPRDPPAARVTAAVERAVAGRALPHRAGHGRRAGVLRRSQRRGPGRRCGRRQAALAGLHRRGDLRPARRSERPAVRRLGRRPRVCLRGGHGPAAVDVPRRPGRRWIPVYGKLMSTWPVAGGVVVQDGVVYAAAGIAHYDGTHVYALDAATGQVKWYNDTSGTTVPESRTRREPARRTVPSATANCGSSAAASTRRPATIWQPASA